MFRLQSPSDYCTLHLMKYTDTDTFSTVQNSSWTKFWCLLVLLPFFVSSLPHWQNISIWGFFFSSSKTNKQTKKVARAEMGWIGRVGHWGHAIFNQKLLNTQHGVGRCAWKSPIMKWANELKESSKKIYWCWMKPLTKPPPSTLMHMGPRTLPQQRKPVLQEPTLPEDNSRVFGSPLVSGRESNWIQYNLQYITCYGTHNVK